MLVSLISLILSLIIDSFNKFLGFSVSFGIVVAILLTYSIVEIWRDNKNSAKKPIYYSPWIFPIYRYNPSAEDIEPHNRHALALVMGLLLCMVWSILCSIWIQPYYIGISITCLVEVLMVTAILFLVSATPLQLQIVQEHKDDVLLKGAWIDAKEKYCSGRNIESV